MKKALRSIVLLANIITTSSLAWAQEQPGVRNLKQAPTAFDAEPTGDFYLGFADGQLIKFGKNGEGLEIFSLPNNSSITLVDAQNRLKPFLFQFDIQQITVLDRFSTVPKTYPLSSFGINLATMACPAPDGDFWILENNPQRLLKYNPLRKAVMLEIQPDIGDSVIRMKSYQNILMIADAKGLHLFDVFGGAIKSIEIQEIQNVQMIKNKAVVFTLSSIWVINPFTGEIESRDVAPKKQTLLRLPNYWVTLQDLTMRLLEIKE